MTQREIKFRVWDIRNSEWLSPTGIGFAIDGQVRYRGLAYNWYALEQFTGLKDKNGKEIYEGDILQDGKKQKGLVFWHNAGFLIEWQERGYEGSRPVEKMIDDCFGYGSVIGNIHENPELLKAA